MTVHVALVGAGWVSLERHLPALRSDRYVVVDGVVAPEPVLAGLSAELNLSERATDLDAPWLDRVDAVMVGTPPPTHFDVVMRALERGKHVLVEKPFAATADEATAMIGRARDLNLQLGVVHNLQFCRAARKAQQLLAAGKIGDLRGVVGLQSSNHRRRLPAWYRSLPLGLFTDESPHLIYLAQAFLGGATVSNVSVGTPLGPDDNTPDVVSLNLRDDQGRPATIVNNFGGALSEWALILLGSKATLVIDLFRDVLIKLPDDAGHVTKDVLRTSAAGIVGHVDGSIRSGFRRVFSSLDYGNAEVVHRFIAAVEGRGELGPISAERGRDVVVVIDACHAAAQRPSD